ncbi:MAG: hypothetical protein RMK29_11025 [Myxococcales bacterium]|nr:hypothetical protein [Myxococcota bacterium]MDW8282238.1 hypothetical protein [Myxococcales bacterium]
MSLDVEEKKAKPAIEEPAPTPAEAPPEAQAASPAPGVAPSLGGSSEAAAAALSHWAEPEQTQQP